MELQTCVNPDEFEWDKLAEPQADQYDSKLILHFALASSSPRCCHQYVPRPLTGRYLFCDKMVSTGYLREECPGAPMMRNGPLDHPHLSQASELLREWPAAYRQFQLLMHTVHPIDFSEPAVTRSGSVSHSDSSVFGGMFGSVFDPVGLAEAFVHEMAHNKLRALGVGNEHARLLIVNGPRELFQSPVTRVGMRPMTAVLHAEYSFVHVVQLESDLLRCPAAEDERPRLLASYRKNMEKICRGWKVVQEGCRADRYGAAFLRGLGSWVERLVAESDTFQKT